MASAAVAAATRSDEMRAIARGGRKVVPRETVYQLVHRIRTGLENDPNIKHKDYCPIYELAKLGMDLSIDVNSRIQCHTTVAKYFYSQRSSVTLSNDPENPVDFKIVAIGKLQVALGIAQPVEAPLTIENEQQAGTAE